MKPKHHIPGLPLTPEPSNLAAVAAAISHPDVVSSGITTTPAGEWALLVTVKPDAAFPIGAIEKNASGFPIIYRSSENQQMTARPAYPRLGE